MMLEHLLSEFRVLIVPGLHGSGAQHWQTRWQQLCPAFERVEQGNWDAPDIEIWSEQLARSLRRSFQPTLIVAHSFGCLTTLHCANQGIEQLAGTLLVAPADPVKFSVADRMRNISLPIPSVVVGSTNDPWMEYSRVKYWSRQWQSELITAGALGHINAESDLGDWQIGLDILQRLALSVEHRSYSA